MAETRPIEVELKYRPAERGGRRAVPHRRGARPVPSELADQDRAARGPLSRHGRPGPREGRLRGAAAPDPRGRDRHGEVARQRTTRAGRCTVARSSRELPIARAEPLGWPPSQARALDPGAVRRCAADRARDGPPAAAQAGARRVRRAGRAEPRRGRHHRPQPDRRALRRARGRAHRRQRGAPLGARGGPRGDRAAAAGHRLEAGTRPCGDRPATDVSAPTGLQGPWPGGLAEQGRCALRRRSRFLA